MSAQASWIRDIQFSGFLHHRVRPERRLVSQLKVLSTTQRRAGYQSSPGMGHSSSFGSQWRSSLVNQDVDLASQCRSIRRTLSGIFPSQGSRAVPTINLLSPLLPHWMIVQRYVHLGDG
jgi:hypothetical protein